MIDGNFIRAEFARYLHEHTHTRWGLDAALMHVGRICYEQGIKDEKERKDMEHNCTMGVGCETAGVCYAEAHNKPEMCGRAPAAPSPTPAPASDADVVVYQSIADSYARDTALAPAEVPPLTNPELDAAIDIASIVRDQQAPTSDLFQDPAAAPAPAPAEVPMPECYVTSGGRDLFSEEQMRTYGDARETAGYARGRVVEKALRGLLNIIDDSRGVDEYHLNGDIAEWDDFPEVEAAKAALRGEVK